MVVNFKVREINRGVHRLTRTPTLIKKKNKETRILILHQWHKDFK